MMILSAKVLACMDIPFKWGQRYGTLPFEYDEGEKRVRLTQSKRRMGMWILSFIATVVAVIFLNYRLVRTWNSEVMKMNPGLRNSCILTAIGCSAFLQYEICLALVYKSIPQTFNSVKDYVAFFQVKYRGLGIRENPGMRPRGRDFRGELLSLNYYLLFVTHVPMWIYLVTTPGHIFHISPSSILGYAGMEMPYMPGITVDGLLTSTFLAVLSELVISTHILFWVFAVLPLQYSLGAIASQFRLQDDSIWTRSILQHPGPFLKVSKQLCLLSKMLVEISEPMLLVVPINLIIAMTYTAFLAIKDDYSSQKLAVGGTFIQLLAVFIVINRLAGKFPQVFANNLDNYLKQGESPLIKKTLKSIRVPKIMAYGLFAPGYELVITGLQTVLDNIISCLTVNSV